jgi:hypothetical protein
MPAMDRIEIRKAGTVYFLNNVEVTQKEYEKTYPPPKLGGGKDLGVGWNRPTMSDSMGVHTSQIEEAEARNRRCGINITYDRTTGQAIVPSRVEQRKLMKVMGLRDNNAFY